MEIRTEAQVVKIDNRDVVEVQFVDAEGRVGCEQFDVQEYLDHQEIKQACAILNELTMQEHPTKWVERDSASAFAVNTQHMVVGDMDVKEEERITLEILRSRLQEHISWAKDWIRRADQVLPPITKEAEVGK